MKKYKTVLTEIGLIFLNEQYFFRKNARYQIENVNETELPRKRFKRKAFVVSTNCPLLRTNGYETFLNVMLTVKRNKQNLYLIGYYLFGKNVVSVVKTT